MTIDEPTALAKETEPVTATETAPKLTAATEGTDDMPVVVMDGCPEYWIG